MARDTTSNKSTLVDAAASYIKRQIVEDRLRPNTKLSENEIAKQMRMSRSPIREALRVLERDGLLTLIPGKGAHVTEITPEDACEIFLLRSCLIGLAIRLSTPNLDAKARLWLDRWLKKLKFAVRTRNGKAYIEITSDFERFFETRCGLPRLTRFIEMLGNPCLRYRAFVVAVPDYMSSAAELYEGIVKAIEAGDGERAERLRRQVSQLGANLIEQYFLKNFRAEKTFSGS